MASEDWIRMRVNIARDPKVLVIAGALARSKRFQAWAFDGDARGRRTGLSTAAVAGIAVNGLLQIWGTARTQGAPSGDDLVLPNLTLEMLDVIAGVPDLGAAMAVVKWAVKTDDGGVVLPKFFLQNASAEELRKRRDAERQRRKRGRDRDALRDSGVTSHGTSHVTVTPKSRTEEEEEEEDKNPPNPPRPGGEEEGEPSPHRRPRPPSGPDPPQPLLDAIAEVTGADPAVNADDVRDVAVALAGADPPYTPDEVREFGRRFHELCTWAVRHNRSRPGYRELRKHIGKLRAASPATSAPVGPSKMVDCGPLDPMPRPAAQSDTKRDRSSHG